MLRCTPVVGSANGKELPRKYNDVKQNLLNFLIRFWGLIVSELLHSPFRCGGALDKAVFKIKYNTSTAIALVKEMII